MCSKLLQLCLTLCDTMDYSPPASFLFHKIFQGKNNGVGCHALLQGNFLTQGSNPCLLTSPALAGRFFTSSANWETWSWLDGASVTLSSRAKNNSPLCQANNIKGDLVFHLEYCFSAVFSMHKITYLLKCTLWFYRSGVVLGSCISRLLEDCLHCCSMDHALNSTIQ